MLRLLIFSAIVLPLAAVSSAQAGYGTLHFQTRLGSFKIVKLNMDAPAEGRLEISFTGTLLISDYQGKDFRSTIKGDIRQEFPDPKIVKSIPANWRKIVLHGKGSLVLDGKYMAVQWFGRDMKANWHGRGFIRLYGEFDDKGDTGIYYFTDPSKTNYWQVPSIELALPGSQFGSAIPRAQPRTGGGKPKPKK
jgi:hypothetical protein